MEDLSEIWVSVRLTIELADVTTVILLIVGTPLAWWLARSKTIWSEAVATIVVLPPILPQPELGFYLLAFLGPAGPGGLLRLSGASARSPTPLRGSLSERF